MQVVGDVTNDIQLKTLFYTCFKSSNGRVTMVRAVLIVLIKHDVHLTLMWPVCMCFRGVGCIFFEMASGRPLFAGSAVHEQLHLIVKLLGTPNELTWPGVSQLQEFVACEFPRYRPEPLVKHVPRSVIQPTTVFLSRDICPLDNT